MAMADEFLTVAEIAELLKVNPQTVRNWIDRGELPAVRVGARRVRVRRTDLDAFIDAGATNNPEPEIEPPMPVDEGSITAWATFGAALTETSARLESADRDQLVETLDALVVATRELVDVLRAATSE
jgi:excisionase family DNA binding protein